MLHIEIVTQILLSQMLQFDGTGNIDESLKLKYQNYFIYFGAFTRYTHKYISKQILKMIMYCMIGNWLQLPSNSPQQNLPSVCSLLGWAFVIKHQNYAHVKFCDIVVVTFVYHCSITHVEHCVRTAVCPFELKTEDLGKPKKKISMHVISKHIKQGWKFSVKICSAQYPATFWLNHCLRESNYCPKNYWIWFLDYRTVYNSHGITLLSTTKEINTFCVIGHLAVFTHLQIDNRCDKL